MCQIQYNSVNHIIEAKLEKGDKSVDITELRISYIIHSSKIY